ncbi:hypothetical protein BB560_006118, partial [Smittium megazygosporum]
MEPSSSSKNTLEITKTEPTGMFQSTPYNLQFLISLTLVFIGQSENPDIQIQLFKEPRKVISYALLFLAEKANNHIIIQKIDQFILWYSYWVFLGVLSSIGLGAGLHTFVLFLGPYIAKVTFLSHQCGNVNFHTFGRNAFICDPNGTVPASFLPIFSKVCFPSLCWGIGTAIGELPPYFLARAASSKSDIMAGISNTESDIKKGVRVSFKDQFMYYVSVVLRYYSFPGILILASIPNPLFDFAGILCGHFGIPFWTFFGATLLGKALIKSSMQTAVVIFAFSNSMLDQILGFIAKISPSLSQLAKNFVLQQRNSFDSGNEDSADSSMLSTVWNGVVVIMMLYFLTG